MKLKRWYAFAYTHRRFKWDFRPNGMKTCIVHVPSNKQVKIEPGTHCFGEMMANLFYALYILFIRFSVSSSECVDS